ncbi:MAG TPA: ribonuclease H-like YkuK family protein [Chitinophagaceae bacterium]|nr:ribonuclease H-like YkuK family protein [Chitinophagaceae bacterium]
MKEEQQWRRFNGELLTRPIADEICSAILREQQLGNSIKVCIGTDSQVKSQETAFATVIVFIRKGRGGFMYSCNRLSKQRMTVKERMLQEVAMSIAAAYQLSGLFTQYNIDMEVHADINTQPQFKSNDALKDAMGYITGMGFAFKAKPQAFASSACANKLVQ